MSWSLQITPEAEDDIQNAYDWYQQPRSGLGNRFLKKLRMTLDVIERSPTIFGEVVLNVWFRLVSRFPYAAYYVVVNNTIQVIAVVHTKRDPQVWKDRL